MPGEEGALLRLRVLAIHKLDAVVLVDVPRPVGDLNHGDQVARPGPLFEITATNFDNAVAHDPLIGRQAAGMDTELPRNLFDRASSGPWYKFCLREVGVRLLSVELTAQMTEDGCDDNEEAN